MNNIIEISGLTKHYPGFSLENVSFVVPQGAIMGLIGENGAGKSTTIKAILNIIKTDGGNIKIFGLDNLQHEKKIKQDLGLVLDDSFLSEYLTPTDVNKIMKHFYNHWDEKLFFKYVTDFKLPPKKIVKEFSSGMKMKLKIITAIAHHPQLLILDEPTSGLDPIARNDILDIFQNFILEDEAHSILVSSHITSDLEHIADYIVFINRGKIAFVKSKDEVIDQFGIVKCGADDFAKIKPQDYLRYRKTRYEHQVLVENKNEFSKKYQLPIIDKPTIEDIMLLYIKGEK